MCGSITPRRIMWMRAILRATSAPKWLRKEQWSMARAILIRRGLAAFGMGRQLLGAWAAIWHGRRGLGGALVLVLAGVLILTTLGSIVSAMAGIRPRHGGVRTGIGRVMRKAASPRGVQAAGRTLRATFIIGGECRVTTHSRETNGRTPTGAPTTRAPAG